MSATLFKRSLRSAAAVMAAIVIVLAFYIAMVAYLHDPEVSESIQLMQAAMPELFEAFGMAADRGRFTADNFLTAEGFSNVFAGGDCQTGPATVIRAIAAGKVAARNIDAYLGYHHTLDCGVEAPPAAPNRRVPTGRVDVPERPARERARDFAACEEAMTEEEAAQECGRCLRCDVFGCGSMEGGRIQYV